MQFAHKLYTKLFTLNGFWDSHVKDPISLNIQWEQPSGGISFPRWHAGQVLIARLCPSTPRSYCVLHTLVAAHSTPTATSLCVSLQFQPPYVRSALFLRRAYVCMGRGTALPKKALVAELPICSSSMWKVMLSCRAFLPWAGTSFLTLGKGCSLRGPPWEVDMSLVWGWAGCGWKKFQVQFSGAEHQHLSHPDGWLYNHTQLDCYHKCRAWNLLRGHFKVSSFCCKGGDFCNMYRGRSLHWKNH